MSIQQYDRKQIEFKSEIHKEVFMCERRIIPFEVSTAEITDNEILEGLRQVYDFTVELFSEMCEDPDKYNLTNDLQLRLDGSDRPPTFIHGYLISLVKYLNKHGKISLAENNWTLKIDDLPKGWKEGFNLPFALTSFFEPLDLLVSMGIISYEINEGTINIKGIKYPLFFKYFFMFCEVSEKRKTHVRAYIVTCDFRILNKRYSKTFDDAVRIFSDSDKEYILELHNHLISKGIKPKTRGICDIKYVYANQGMLRILDCSTNLLLIVSLGENTDDEHYKFLIDEIGKLSNKDELLDYIFNNIGYCNKCDGAKPNPCYREMEFFGKRQRLCGFNLDILKSRKQGEYYNDHDIKTIKQILDLRIKAIDNH